MTALTRSYERQCPPFSRLTWPGAASFRSGHGLQLQLQIGATAFIALATRFVLADMVVVAVKVDTTPKVRKSVDVVIWMR